MSYSFKGDVISRLPAGHSLIRMFSVSETETSVETLQGSVKHTFSMPKVDISSWFFKVPTVSLRANATHNDLYALLSDIYALGLTESVDYYDTSPVEPSLVPKYIELPILKDSHGYTGFIRCRVVQDDFGAMGKDFIRDLTQVSMLESFTRLKIRNYLAGNLFIYADPIFIDDKLSIGFIDYVSSISYDELGSVGPALLRDVLIRAFVVDAFNDGISDITILKTENSELFFLRYLSKSGKIPAIKNNESSDLEIDNSKGLPIDSDDSSAENPGEGKGDINNTNDSEYPYSSTEGEWEIEESIEIEII